MKAITIRGRLNPRTGEYTGAFGSGIEGEDSGLLAIGHWIPTFMPLRAVHPRPDAETATFDRHRNYHPQMLYEIPIGVQGGAWPHFYQFVEAPAGATIGSWFGQPNHGVVSWRPSPEQASGVYRFIVQAVDQDGGKIRLSWTTTYNASAFVFIDSKVAVAGDGSYSSRLKLFADWYKNSVNDATYHNRIAVFVGGGADYSVVGDTSDGNVKFNLAAKTNTIIGDPDNLPTFDCSTAKFYSNVKLDGLYVSHIRHKNARNDVNNPHFWWVASNPNRVTFFRNDFTAISHGLVGNDNTGPIMLSDGDGSDVLIKYNVYHDFSNHGGGNGTYCTIFEFENVLIEYDLAYNTSTGSGWCAKGTFNNTTLRCLTAIDNVQGTQVAVGYGAECGRPPQNHEVEYCNIKVPSGQTPLMVANSNWYAGVSGPVSIHRNTLNGGAAWIRFPGVTPHRVDANIVVTETPAKWEPGSMVTTVPNVVAATPTNLLDPVTNRLVGAGEAYLYTKGWEVG